MAKKQTNIKHIFIVLKIEIANNTLSVDYDLLSFPFSSIFLGNQPRSFSWILCHRAGINTV